MPKNNGYTGERAVCPVCKRVVACVVPVGGDGSGVVFRRHRTPDRGVCLGGRQDVNAGDIIEEANDAE